MTRHDELAFAVRSGCAAEHGKKASRVGPGAMLRSVWERLGAAAEYMGGRGSMFGVAGLALLVISGFAAWAGMEAFVSARPLPDRPPGSIAVDRSAFILILSLVLTFLIWLSVREIFRSGRSLGQRMLFCALYGAAAGWSIVFGFEFWSGLIAGRDSHGATHIVQSSVRYLSSLMQYLFVGAPLGRTDSGEPMNEREWLALLIALVTNLGFLALSVSRGDGGRAETRPAGMGFLRRKPRVFISYRRDDHAGDARGIRDGLASRFGEANVFMDIDNLRAGQRFDEELAGALALCDVLIAVIGPRWMEILEAKKQRADPDYVAMEIAEALKRRIVVIPVRVGREDGLPALPRREALPANIRDLVLYQKHDVTHERFGRDMDSLAEAIALARVRKPAS